jgi:class 3 adenylate cyclase
LSDDWVERCLTFVGVQVADESKFPSECSVDEQLRCSERTWVVVTSVTEEEKHHTHMAFAFDTRGETQLEGLLSICQTLFICMCVAIGAMGFNRDANQLLLHPIERMIAKMESIKDNPLEAMRLGDLEYRREEILEAKRAAQLAKRGSCMKVLCRLFASKKMKEPMETAMLEKTIIKLGGLLALGFGEAGAEVIGHNLKGGSNKSSNNSFVNAMVPGHKVNAILGFCNIRHFMEATIVLKEQVMLFVNQVGEIVHGCVDDYHGSPNKNIGDSFLLVWRCLAEFDEKKQEKLADMAIMSFIKIVGEVNKSRVLAAYRSHPGLLQRVPNFRVQMGFGLHCGWVIEGAIGSEFKIDASYLSPNVNVASRLESAASQFGVYMLISHFLVELCSQETALQCRLIDHVTVKGCREPFWLYTVDLDPWNLAVQTRGPNMLIKNRFKMRQLREIQKAEKWTEDYCVWEMFSQDDDVVAMRARFSTEFFQRFSMAYRNYEAGEWLAARDMLYTCHYSPQPDSGYIVKNESEWPEDGPTVSLLTFMKQHNFCPPERWPGYRDLVEQ